MITIVSRPRHAGQPSDAVTGATVGVPIKEFISARRAAAAEPEPAGAAVGDAPPPACREPAPPATTPVVTCSGVRSMADVLACVLAQPPSDHRNVLASAVRKLATICGCSPHDIPAHAGEVSKRLERMSAAMAGLSRGSFANLRSNLRAALKLSGRPFRQGRRTKTLPEPYRSLYEKLDLAGKAGLGRFFDYASEAGWPPDDIGPEHLARFHSVLQDEAIIGDPRGSVRATLREWNKARASIDNWPDTELTDPLPKAEVYVLPPEAYPPRFGVELGVYLARLSDPPLDDDTAPARPLAFSTVKQRRFNLLQYAGALVASGLPADAVDSLSALTDLPLVDRLLDWFGDRFGRRDSTTALGMLDILATLARHGPGADPERERLIKRRRATISKDRCSGMTPKNRRRLAAVDDERMVHKFFLLPLAMAREAEALLPDRPAKAASLMRTAVAIQILLNAPIRVGNLAALEIDRHLVRSGGRSGHLTIQIPQHETKNKVAIELPLPARSSELVERYLTRFRHALMDGPQPAGSTRFLFPRRDGGATSGKVLATAIGNAVKHRVGVEWNAHLFRHLACKLYLDRNPNGHEVLRRLLGHKSIDTTTTHYAHMGMSRSAQLYDEEILKIRAGAASPRAGRPSDGRPSHGG